MRLNKFRAAHNENCHDSHTHPGTRRRRTTSSPISHRASKYGKRSGNFRQRPQRRKQLPRHARKPNSPRDSASAGKKTAQMAKTSSTRNTLKTQQNHNSKARKSWLQEYMRKNMGRQFYTIPYDLPSMINIGNNIPKGFDVINCHNYPSEWAAVAAKKRIKAPVVWMCNEPPFWFFVPELRKGLRKVNWPVYNLLGQNGC